MVEETVVWDYHLYRPTSGRGEMGFVLLLHKVDSPEQKRSQCLGYQVAPSLKNIGNLVKQGVGIEPGRAGEE
ncbi:hypothetical protein SDC9_94133 [bioreactor metagenome]|uniref:Uncharacterized protein n=1 Tax=bioreactor metagenome TaxID=1076179 RepID=A0A645A992_9ZZZZ